MASNQLLNEATNGLYILTASKRDCYYLIPIEPFWPPSEWLVLTFRLQLMASSRVHIFYWLLGFTFFIDIRMSYYIELIVRSAANKFGSLFRARQFSSPESILPNYKSTICPCIEYCCYILSDASAIYIYWNSWQIRVCNVIGPDLCISTPVTIPLLWCGFSLSIL